MTSYSKIIKWWVVVAVLGLVIGVGYYLMFLQSSSDWNRMPILQNFPSSSTVPQIDIFIPQPNEKILSPFTIRGKTKLGWVVFEGQAGTVRIFDDNGKELGLGLLKAVGEWMKTEVDFEVAVPFEKSETPGGTLVFRDDNPKDESEQKTFMMPIQFSEYGAPYTGPTQKIKLFYQNLNKASEIGDPCDQNFSSVISLDRKIPKTQTPIQDAIRTLIEGKLTASEKNLGFTTEFPLPEFLFVGANLKNGVLTLEFSDLSNKTNGGSCRVGLLWTQISRTAMQFTDVKEVRFVPETLFQP